MGHQPSFTILHLPTPANRLTSPPSPFVSSELKSCGKELGNYMFPKKIPLRDSVSAVERLKRLQATVPSQTKAQPSHSAKACHCMVKPGTSTYQVSLICAEFPPAVATSSPETAPKNDESGSVARSSALKPCPWHPSQGLTSKEHEEQYLDSFHTKIVALKDGLDDEDGYDRSGHLDSSLDSHLPAESQDAFNDHDAHEQFSPVPPSENVFQDQSSQSEEDEWEVESGMQKVNHASDAENGPAGSTADKPSDSDWSDTERCQLKHKQTTREILAGNYDIDAHPSTPLEFPTSSEETMDTEDVDQHRRSKKSNHILTMASKDSDLAQEDTALSSHQKAQALGMCTAQEAQAIADEYGKTVTSIMAAAGLTTKATWAESVWNMHQAWCVLLDPDPVIEVMKDYHCCQMKHYESHKDKEEFPDLWAEICKFWSKSISGSNDMSSKGIVGWLMTCRDLFTQAAQTWCNVENIHIFGCVIYSGNDEATHQAQGIFAGSLLCTQLASERQMDIARLLDYLTTIIKYKVLDSSVNVPLPAFSILSGISYDHVLALKPLKSTQDRNWQVLPLVILHKLHKPILVCLVSLSPKAVADKVEITCGQKNVPWKTLLDLLFTHKHTIIDWLAGVPAVNQHFNIKCLTANELCTLTVPFLKEQMGKDYEMETMVDDEDGPGDFIVPVPASSFHLKPWTAAKMKYSDQLALACMMNPKAFDIPLVINTFGRPLRLLSDSQAFLNVVPRGMHHEDMDEERASTPTPIPSSPQAGMSL
ncbi:hypothetical protein EDC04DRAFT_2609525 [Pisolithus marmoratus]|nr:hypothetical protein EDC04DRAFT_2609525 [Pisolithus marmoratus]